MLDFRKVLLALSVAGLGLVGTASAQIPTYTVGGATGYVAAEGTTEGLPNLTLTETAATPIAGGATFLLTSNVPFANQFLSGSTTKLDATATDGTNSATVTQPGPTTIQLSFTALATNAVITVSGLRVNSSLAPVSSYVTISVSSTGVAITPGAGSSVNLGFVSKSLSSIVVNPAPVAPTSSCGLLKTTVFPVANIQISEGFPDSLKAVTDVTAGNAPTQGTVLAVTFTNLDGGVNYYVPTTAGSLPLTLTAYTAATGGVAATPIASGTGAGSILVTSAAPTVYYQVTASGGTAATYQFTIPVTASVPSVSGVTAFSTTPVGATIVLAGAAAPSYFGYSGGITYTGTLASTTQNNGLITPCATTLLFPYVVNTSGFDTGIAIANASTLPTGVTGITASSGTCSVTFYGTGASTVAPISYNYGAVNTGTVGAAFALSGTPAAGLTGYAVAVCNFVGAHGYAILLDSAGANSVAGNYLAVVLSSGAAVYTPAPAGALTPTF